MQNLTGLYFLACSESVHTTTALFHTSYVSIICFSIKVISQAKGALCSANILGEQWMVIDELKYLQGSHATESTIHVYFK